MTREQLSDGNEEIGPEFDWERLVDLALYHRVYPLVHWNMKRLGVEGVPAETAKRLCEYFDHNQRRIMGLTAELVELAGEFESAGVRAVWLKGPALASTVYGNVALRPAGDLDVLVRGEESSEALQLLRERGYRIRLGEGGGDASPAQVAAIRRFQYHCVLVDACGHVVELHSELSPSKLRWGPTAEEAVAGASSGVLASRTIHVLNPVDNLVYLCVHGGKHAWERLEWLVGAAALMRAFKETDENRLRETAERGGAETFLLLGVALAHRLCGVSVFPGLLKRALGVPVVERLTEQVVRNLDCVDREGSEERLQQRFQNEICSTFGRKARLFFLRKVVPNCADIAAAHWNPPLQFLYYLGPLRRLVSEAVRRVFRASARR